MPEESKEKTQKKRWTLKKVKTRCRTIYWQNFLLTASVVMLTLALLGSAFFALTYSYAIDERSEQMQSKATVVSHMVSSYMENGSLTGLRELADFASNVTDAEFLICNSDVQLLATCFIQICGLCMPIFGFVNAAYFTLRAGGKTVITFFFDSAFMWVATIPVVFV